MPKQAFSRHLWKAGWICAFGTLGGSNEEVGDDLPSCPSFHANEFVLGASGDVGSALFPSRPSKLTSWFNHEPILRREKGSNQDRTQPTNPGRFGFDWLRRSFRTERRCGSVSGSDGSCSWKRIARRSRRTAMKLTLKTVAGKQFQVDADATETVRGPSETHVCEREVG